MKAEIIFTDDSTVIVDMNEPTIDVSTDDGLQIVIVGGVGPQGRPGDKGDKGDKGDTTIVETVSEAEIDNIIYGGL